MAKRFRPLIWAALVLGGLGIALRLSLAASPPPAGSQPAAGAAAEKPAEPAPTKRFTMIAVGDIMTDRNVDKAIRANGMHSILARVADVTKNADVSFANLECPLSTEGPHDPSNCSFRARPDTVQVVLDGGFDIVSLANNHFLNAGRAAVLQTLDLLDKHQILYCGARRDREKGGEATFVEVGNPPVKLGFIAATDLSFEHGSYNKVARDRANLVAQIQAARPLCDKLFVSFHWGDEYQGLPNERQRGTAHAALDAGADVVLGHHPHTLQGLEVYKGKLILYSMGNFVFDQKEGERMESAIFHLKWIDGWGWEVWAKPIWIPRSRMGPIFPEPARRDKILARLARLSKPHGTTLQLKDGKAWLRVPEGQVAATTPPAVP